MILISFHVRFNACTCDGGGVILLKETCNSYHSTFSIADLCIFFLPYSSVWTLYTTPILAGIAIRWKPALTFLETQNHIYICSDDPSPHKQKCLGKGCKTDKQLRELHLYCLIVYVSYTWNLTVKFFFFKYKAILQHFWVRGLCPLCSIVNTTCFEKCLFLPSSEKKVGGTF